MVNTIEVNTEKDTGSEQLLEIIDNLFNILSKNGIWQKKNTSSILDVLILTQKDSKLELFTSIKIKKIISLLDETINQKYNQKDFLELTAEIFDTNDLTLILQNNKNIQSFSQLIKHLELTDFNNNSYKNLFESVIEAIETKWYDYKTPWKTNTIMMISLILLYMIPSLHTNANTNNISYNGKIYTPFQNLPQIDKNNNLPNIQDNDHSKDSIPDMLIPLPPEDTATIFSKLENIDEKYKILDIYDISNISEFMVYNNSPLWINENWFYVKKESVKKLDTIKGYGYITINNELILIKFDNSDINKDEIHCQIVYKPTYRTLETDRWAILEFLKTQKDERTPELQSSNLLNSNDCFISITEGYIYNNENKIIKLIKENSKKKNIIKFIDQDPRNNDIVTYNIYIQTLDQDNSWYLFVKNNITQEFITYYYELDNKLTIKALDLDYEDLYPISQENIKNIFKQTILQNPWEKYNFINYNDNDTPDYHRDTFWANCQNWITNRELLEIMIKIEKIEKIEYKNKEWMDLYTFKDKDNNISLRYKQWKKYIPIKKHKNIDSLFQEIENEIKKDYLYLLDTNLYTNKIYNDIFLSEKKQKKEIKNKKRITKNYKKEWYTIKFSEDEETCIVYKKWDNWETYVTFYYKDKDGKYKIYNWSIWQYLEDDSIKKQISQYPITISDPKTEYLTFFKLTETNDTNNIININNFDYPIFNWDTTQLNSDIAEAITRYLKAKTNNSSDQNNWTKQFGNIIISNDWKLRIIKKENGETIIIWTYKIEKTKQTNKNQTIIAINNNEFINWSTNPLWEIFPQDNKNIKVNIDKDGNKTVKLKKKKEEKEYSVHIPVGKNYWMAINSEGHMFYSQNFNLIKNNKDSLSKERQEEAIKQTVKSYKIIDNNGTKTYFIALDKSRISNPDFFLSDKIRTEISWSGVFVERNWEVLTLTISDWTIVWKIIPNKNLTHKIWKEVLTEIDKIIEKIKNNELVIEEWKTIIYNWYKIEKTNEWRIIVYDIYDNEILNILQWHDNIIWKYNIAYQNDWSINIFEWKTLIYHYNKIKYNMSEIKKEFYQTNDSTEFSNFDLLKRQIEGTSDSIFTKDISKRFNSSLKDYIGNFIILPNWYFYQKYGSAELIGVNMIWNSFYDNDNGILYQFTNNWIVLYIAEKNPEDKINFKRINFSNPPENFSTKYDFVISTTISKILADNLTKELKKNWLTNAFTKQIWKYYEVRIPGTYWDTIINNMTYNKTKYKFQFEFLGKEYWIIIKKKK